MLGINDQSLDAARYIGSIEQYQIVREIGSKKTHLYPVYLASYYDFDRKETVNCVVKAISNLTAFKNELEVYNLKPHASILKCIQVIENYTIDFGQYKTQSYNLLVFPYLKNGDLFNLIQKNPLDEQTLRYYVESIINVIEYLHNNGFAHRDIKPDNILLDDNFNPILIDFGHTVKYSDELGPKLFKERSDITTEGICPPEFHKKIGYYGTRMDMFALGRLIFNLATSLRPFQNTKAGDPYFDMIAKGEWEPFWRKVQSGMRASRNPPGVLSEELKELIQGLLQPLSDKRLTIEEVRTSAWFRSTTPKALDEIQCQILKAKLSR
jgi:serine/threonine protein kinase